MNELDILKLFYDEMKTRGTTRDNVFLNMDEQAAEVLTAKTGQLVTVEDAQKFTDICIANEWLERTTIDPNYNFLSLTEVGLSIIIASEYR